MSLRILRQNCQGLSWLCCLDGGLLDDGRQSCFVLWRPPSPLTEAARGWSGGCQYCSGACPPDSGSEVRETAKLKKNIFCFSFRHFWTIVLKRTEVKILTNILSILDITIEVNRHEIQPQTKFCFLFFSNLLVHFVERSPTTSEDVYFLRFWQL